MLEVYDRVIPSRSIPTLVALLVLAGGLYAAQGIIDAIRSRILVRIGNSLDETLSLRVYDAIVRLPLTLGVRSEGAEPIRDLDTVRGYLSGTGPIALFDLPWLPIYLGMCFLFHTYIGLAALSGAIILVALTLLTEMLTRRPTRSATQFAAQRRGDHGHGHDRPHRPTLERPQPQLRREHRARERRRRRLWCDVEGSAHDAAVRPARGRRLAGDPSGVHLRHHHRRIDPRQPRPGAGRSRHRQLARFRRRQAGLEAAFAPLHGRR